MLIDSHVLYSYIYVDGFNLLSNIIKTMAFVKSLVDDTCFHLIGQFIISIHLKIHVASYE
jgi:hypothetical protein